MSDAECSNGRRPSPNKRTFVCRGPARSIRPGGGEALPPTRGSGGADPEGRGAEWPPGAGWQPGWGGPPVVPRICGAKRSRAGKRVGGQSPGAPRDRGHPESHPARAKRSGGLPRGPHGFSRSREKRRVAAGRHSDQSGDSSEDCLRIGVAALARRPRQRAARRGSAPTQPTQGRRPGAQARQGVRHSRTTQCAEPQSGVSIARFQARNTARHTARHCAMRRTSCRAEWPASVDE